MRNGMTVHRLPAALSERSTALSRGWENLSFGLLSMLAVLTGPKPDILYVNSWPILASGFAALAARVRGIPYVISVQDLYPESLITQARGWAGRLARLLFAVDAAIARNAAGVIVITPRFVPAYRARGVPAERTHVVRNWVEIPRDGDEGASDLREQLGMQPNDFVFAYGGNIGVAAGVPALIDAHAMLADSSAVLCIAGSGSELQSCQRRVSPSSRVVFRSPWPAEETQPLLRAADVVVLTTHGAQGTASVPSKLINYMLSGRPVLAAVADDSETADVIRTAGCGWIVPPNADALAAKMREVRTSSRDVLRTMGAAGREYALRHFTAPHCVPTVVRILHDAATQRVGV